MPAVDPVTKKVASSSRRWEAHYESLCFSILELANEKYILKQFFEACAKRYLWNANVFPEDKMNLLILLASLTQTGKFNTTLPLL